jgi:hypothetical protein
MGDWSPPWLQGIRTLQQIQPLKRGTCPGRYYIYSWDKVVIDRLGGPTATHSFLGFCIRHRDDVRECGRHKKPFILGHIAVTPFTALVDPRADCSISQRYILDKSEAQKLRSKLRNQKILWWD